MPLLPMTAVAESLQEAADETYRVSGVARKCLLAEKEYDAKLAAAITAAMAYADAVDALLDAKQALGPIQSKARAEGIPTKPRDGLNVRCAQSGDVGWSARSLLAKLQKATACSW